MKFSIRPMFLSGLAVAALVFPAVAGAQDTNVVAQDTNVVHAAKLACDQPTYDFGQMDNSQDVEHSYVLKNDGDLTLEIRNVRAACGCTVVSISERNVPPGGTTQVSAKLSLRNRTGPQHKTISVESNDPKQPNFVLTLQGIATAEVQLNPNQLFFGRISSESVITGVVAITIQTTNTINSSGITKDSTSLETRVESTADPKVSRLLVVTQPPLSPGTFRSSIHVPTDNPRYPSLEVIVSAFVVSDITYDPQEIAVAENPAEGVSRAITVHSEIGKPIEFVDIIPPYPFMQAALTQTDQFTYRIEVKNIVATSELNGKEIHLKTKMEGREKEIVIPFRVFGSPQPAPAPAPTPAPTQP